MKFIWLIYRAGHNVRYKVIDRREIIVAPLTFGFEERPRSYRKARSLASS